MKNNAKLVLVTGANGGIGEAAARRFLSDGYSVACGYHSRKDRIDALARTNLKAYAVKMDIGSRQSVKTAVKKIKKHFGKTVDIVVNNAGIADEKPFESITNKDWDRMLAVNLRGAFMVVQETIAPMRKQRFGRIIIISSIGGQWGGMRQVHYAAAKAGLISLTHSLSKLYAKEGITSNAIAPGLVDTPMIQKELRSAAGRRKLKEIPIGRVSAPDEIAAAIAFLASEDAGSITGQTLNINGGMLFS